MISFKYVERASIDLNVREGRRNEDVWIGISIAVGVGGKIVRQKISPNRDELRNGPGRDPPRLPVRNIAAP